MNCTSVEKSLLEWEQNGNIPYEDVQLMKKHIQKCENCHLAHQNIILFIEHTGAENKKDQDFLPEDIKNRDLTQSIMDRVTSTEFSKKKKRKVPVKFIYGIAAGIIMMLGIGIISNITYKNLNPDAVYVHFELYAPKAKSVSLVGDFNNWEPLKLDSLQQGSWKKTIKLKKEQSYFYNFLIDDQIWIPDPQAEINVEDGFGGLNSVIKL